LAGDHRVARSDPALPFNAELAAGSLERDRFRHYITQDALYLGQFSRCPRECRGEGSRPALLQSFAQSALRVVAVERTLHEQYLRQYGVDPTTLATAEPAPDCLAYTSFLTATAYREPWPVLVAALLPCFWLYWDVGCAIAGKPRPTIPIALGSIPMPILVLARRLMV
jgi:thiaminase/transcriptional activator TenA